ncbi:FHA domain-containing protein [Arthrobacter echini]|uniref:FHA domain-containing protein n=1 Tax=Arthrobacter echini TaxID=1529066 RepID=A0A5D0XLM4_9MICC|nr:FtsK/SpoIIIE domain-containing protein [Arthrobacter echini]TYC97445.1 FHA domain-containing protein [Arthrobacter echini]
MDLHITLVDAPPAVFPAREIVVDTDVLRSGVTLAERLEAAGHRGPFTVDGVPLTTLSPLAGALPDGAVVVAGLQPCPPRSERLPHLVFVVRSGPDAGQVVPLTRGSYTIGRADSDIVIADPALSRRQALLTVGADTITLEDLGSANGTVVDDEPITTALITVAAVVAFGTSRCGLELVDGTEWLPSPAVDVLAPIPLGVELPAKPSRILVLTAFLPLVLGVVLALTTGMWFFLAFSALSAVTGMVPLLTYRRSSKDFARTVCRAAGQDRDRRSRAVPDPGQTALDALRHSADPILPGNREEPRAPTLALLRLGLAAQPARLTVNRADQGFVPPVLPELPLLLPCAIRAAGAAPNSMTVTGEADAVHALSRALLLQLAHPAADPPPVLCWGPPSEVPRHARFLPNVRLSHDVRVLASLTASSSLLLVFQFSDDLPDMSAAPHVCIIDFRGGDAVTDQNLSTDHVRLCSGSARARLGGIDLDVRVDGVSSHVFERTARLLARSKPLALARARLTAGTAGGLPRSASLWTGDLSPGALTETARPHWARADPGHPVARLGRAASGDLFLDLVDDGPHLLVAGTTGSGKSEFLRTLVLALAVDQPPELLTMLLIDYKGGSGLGALAALPHCVGSLTDLSSESTARALTSLRAELRRRETLCADHGASDLGELRQVAPAACPPRLLVVIDEFRMLSEDVPGAVQDLLKIAALGRSLGVHLVLATQRAQGAVTPDLRANITSSILLRVQTAMESHDLLGSGAAAEIGVDFPGRAYLRRGGEVPVAFQVASSSSRPPASTTTGWQDLAAYVTGEDPAARAAPGPDPAAPAGVLDTAVRALGAAAGDSPTLQLSRPVLPPLPTLLPAAAVSGYQPADRPGRCPPGEAVPLGVADFPDVQTQRLLLWHPGGHSHLALVGLGGSGSTAALASSVSRLPVIDPDLHLYLLDGDGSLSASRDFAQIGAYVHSHETRRAGRVLSRLASLPLQEPGSRPHIVLVITGWGHWSTRFRQGRSLQAEEDLHTVARDGVTRGVSILISGDRELTTARFFALLPNRVYLPLGAHQETTLTWPKLPLLDAVAGRGFVQGPLTGASGDGACQLIADPAGQDAVTEPPRPPVTAPFPVHPLPRLIRLDELRRGPGERRSCPAGAITVGVHGDDLATLSVSLLSGEVYLVLGPPGSGRSTVLRVFARSPEHLRAGRRLLAPPPGTGAPEYWRGVRDHGCGEVPPERIIALVDDADRLPADVQQILSSLVTAGAAAVLSAAPGPALLTRVPLSLQARGSGRGMVLAPRTPADGDFFGLRPEVEGPPAAGRGWACEPSGAVELQIAWPADAPDTGPLQTAPVGAPARAFFRSPPGAP